MEKSFKNQDIENRQKKRLNITFSNALIVLLGVAILSIVIYGVIVSLTGSPDTSLPNQLNNSTQSTRQIVNEGDGYQVYKIDGQYFLEITNGAKVKDINGLIKTLDLPDTTEVINPAAAYPRPVTPADTEDTDHEDLNFDPINPQPEQPKVVPNE